MPITGELYEGASVASSDSGFTSLFNTNYNDTRSEILITKRDLEEHWIQRGDKILDLSLFVTVKSGKNLTNVKIGIKHVAINEMNSTSFNPYNTFQQVYSVASIPSSSIIANQWFTFKFSSEFVWNGADSILLTFIADGSGTITGGGQWRTKEVNGNRYIGYRANNTVASPFDNQLATKIANHVPSMRITLADRPQLPSNATLVTNGLLGYWNSKKGVNGNVWSNISPVTKGEYNGVINGATANQYGMYYNGVGDYVEIPLPLEMQKKTSATLEMIIKSDNEEGWIGQKIISQHSSITIREYLVALYRRNVVLAGVFDSIRDNDINLLIGSDLLDPLATYAITITADITTSKINCYAYNFGSGALFFNSYHAEISTLSENGSFMLSGIGNGASFKGYIDCVRLYNRALTEEEILQNRSIGENLGLPNAISNVNYLVADKQKISDETNMNKSIITVRFDNNVTEYVARLNGSDYATGLLVHQGGAVLANTDAQVVIDWNELSTEGANRINIYGKSEDGVWTEYQN